ncbi:TPA: hypothetical protein I8374_002054 [Serratia marcescens]|nr:hypothetical protein [Serratia marcescens]HAT2872852.1 hypothetical protein [Serratia marcescens]HAT2923505.1 hypothetical protein [Serratia marcescens]
MYKLIRKIPVLGAIFRIVNAYAYKGKSECNRRVAPLCMWWSRIFKKLTYVVLFVELLFLIRGDSLSSLSWEPADSILSVFPSILGFGIGVFALVFVMPSDFMKFFMDRRKRLSFGPEIVPVDMAYPLVVFVLVMMCAVLGKIFPSNALTFITSCAFFYGLAMAFELISFLFNTSYLIQSMKSKGSVEK